MIEKDYRITVILKNHLQQQQKNQAIKQIK